jgi:UDP-N-acetylmuramoyl-tripeptide--D-alanyl-D-alanine ligase
VFTKKWTAFLFSFFIFLATSVFWLSAETSGPQTGKPSRELLDQSLQLGKQFMLNSQKPEGNFHYQYDFVAQKYTEDDNSVRQAGALWSLALLHGEDRSRETFEAVKRGLGFFDRHSQETTDGRKFIIYPGEKEGKTGTVALVTLALIEFLRAEANFEERKEYEKDLAQYIQFLLSLRTENGQFHRYYGKKNGEPEGPPSPYFDGETLLALTKAAKYVGFERLKEGILESAEAMHQANVSKPLKKGLWNKTTKGFYQWGSMAYYELYTSGWPGVEKYADRTLYLASWMIYVSKPLEKKGNTGYAFEGLVSAWELARLIRHERALKQIGEVIDEGLLRLSSWQVGASFQNPFLKSHPTTDPRAVGGALNVADEPLLRIDTTQHQMHAVILARRFIYRSWPFGSRQ